MGKQILSTAITLDVSSMSAAPVSPAGAMRIRPKSDGSTIQLSYNAGAYFDLGGGGGGGAPGGVASEIQFRAGTSTFGAVTNSAVSGADITLNGVFTNGVASGKVVVDPTSGSPLIRLVDYDAPPLPVLRFEGSRGSSGTPVNLSTGDTSGRIDFQGQVAGSMQTLCMVDGRYLATHGASLFMSTASERTFIRISNASDSVTIEGNNTGTTHTFQVSGNGIFLTPGSAGSVYYRNSSSFLAGVTIGTAGQVLTVTDIGGGVLEPRWAAAPGGGGSPPGGSGSELQYRAGASTFGAVTSSSVSGADITVNGVFTDGTASQKIVVDPTLTNPTIRLVEFASPPLPTIRFEGSRGSSSTPVNLTVGDTAGRIDFQGQVAGTMQTLGTIDSAYLSTYGASLVLATASARTFVRISNATDSVRIEGNNTGTTHTLDVSGNGIFLTPGSSGSIYYRNASSFLTGLTIGASGTFVKSNGTVPTYAALDAADIQTGTLAIARGGTALTSTPSNGQLLIGNGTNYTLATLTAGTNVSITNGAGSITINSSASGGSPGGSGTELQYRSGASTFGALTSSSVSGSQLTLGGNLIMSAGTISFPDNIRQTFNPGTNNPGLNVGSHSGDPSTPTNGDIVYNSTAGVFKFYQAGAWVSLSSTTPGGSGSELQYRSGASTFGAVSNSSVSGSVITLGTSTDFTTLQGASIALQGDNGIIFGTRVHHATLPPIFSTTRSRGSAASKSAVQSGDILYRTDHYGYYDASSTRLAGQTHFTARANWSSTEASTTYGVSTLHGTNVVPLMRETLGGFKILTDNTLTNLFTFTFSTSDHKAAAGEIELIFMAKQTSGGNQIACYRRMMNFSIYHNGATNTGVMQVIANSGGSGTSGNGGNTAIETSGTFDIKHTTGSAGSEVAITTSLLPTTFDSVTYKVLVDSSFTVSAMYCFFNVRMNGEVEMTLA